MTPRRIFVDTGAWFAAQVVVPADVGVGHLADH
jgi:hypothetical protein